MKIAHSFELDGPPEVNVSIPKTEWDAHVQRVESLCTLIDGVMGTLANNPMFAALLGSTAHDVRAIVNKP